MGLLQQGQKYESDGLLWSDRRIWLEDSSSLDGLWVEELLSNADGFVVQWVLVVLMIYWLAGFPLLGKPFNRTFIAIYAQILSAEPSFKDEFCNRLQPIVDGVPRKEILIITFD